MSRRVPETMLAAILRLHERVRDSVVEACERKSVDQLSRVANDDDEGDTIYAVDRISEELLLEIFEQEIATEQPLVLIAEGIADGQIILPRGTAETDAVWRIIVDPIDGTRGLMYQKRSGWVLTGVAPNRGPETNLPGYRTCGANRNSLVKQHLSDVLWARVVRSKGEAFNRLTRETEELQLQPSRSPTIRHGFAMIARFFPGAAKSFRRSMKKSCEVR